MYITGLLVFSALGAYHLRAASPERYGRFAYACAVLFGLMPVVMGDWHWALIALPAGLVFAYITMQRRAANLTRRQSDPPDS